MDDYSPPNTAYNFHRTVLSEEQLFSKGIELGFLQLDTPELRGNQ